MAEPNPTEESYTLTGPAFEHVKSALMLAAQLAQDYADAGEMYAALDSLDTAVCIPVEGPIA